MILAPEEVTRKHFQIGRCAAIQGQELTGHHRQKDSFWRWLSRVGYGTAASGCVRGFKKIFHIKPPKFYLKFENHAFSQCLQWVKLFLKC